jgi:hypothetical protein
MATTLTRPKVDIKSLDPYAFLAVLGKRVIHPGGRRSTEELMTARGPAQPARARNMAWMMPRLRKAVPFLGYVLVAGFKPSIH